MNTPRQHRGMTLIELVVAITIIGVTVSIVLGTLALSANKSAQAMVREQATAIASAYLQDVLSQPFPSVAAYNNLNHVGAHDHSGAAVPGLGAYRINITVIPTALGGILSTNSFRIDVKVTDPEGNSYVLSGYRTNHS